MLPVEGRPRISGRAKSGEPAPSLLLAGTLQRPAEIDIPIAAP